MKTTARALAHAPRRTSARRLLPALLALAAACGSGDEGTPVEDALARDRAAAWFQLAQYETARDALRPLVEREEPALEDLLRQVNLELADPPPEGLDAARAWLARARAIAPDDPVVLWASYRFAKDEGDFARALALVERLHALAPEDYPTRLALANMLDEAGREEEAERHYRALLAEKDAFGEGWYRATVYRTFTFLQRRGRREEAEPWQREVQRLDEAGVKTAEVDRGTFGTVEPATRGEVAVDDAWERWMGDAPEGRLTKVAEAESAGIAGLEALVLDDELPWTRALAGEAWVARAELLANDPAARTVRVKDVGRVPTALLVWGPGGLRIATAGADALSFETVLAGPVACAAAFDVDLPNPDSERAGQERYVRDGKVELLAATPDGLAVLERGSGGWAQRGAHLLPGAFAVSALQPVDFDHDGDLDVLAVGSGGVRLLRNDGFGAPGGGFTEATREAGLPRERAFAWCFTEDLDADNDVDLVLGGRGGAYLASNERGGRFSDRSSALVAALASDVAPLCADVDADGWPDLVALSGGRASVFGGARGLSFAARGAGALFADADAQAAAILATPLGEPRVRCVWPDAARGILAARVGSGEAQVLLSTDGALGGPLLAADLDGDSLPELVTASADRLRLCDATTDGRAVTLVLQGVKDNRRGVGAVVEVRAGPMYRRIYWRGRPETIGVGAREKIDRVRVTWPNGIIQDAVDLDAPGSYQIVQREGLAGSCPFLYAWNGERYTFVSDVLGITPLGLPMAPGRLVPPDHDEYVLIAGFQLAPRDGAFDVQITEELREVTYLDRVRLDVVDHPAGTEVWPNERFTFPPFPEALTHVVRDPLVPRATDGEGRDWSAALAAIDGAYAVPFRPLFGQFLGLATPHVLELAFEPERVRDARRLRLLLTGWFYWTDASVNVAAARHPEIAFVPPLLEVPDGEGGWRGFDEPLGFPAGKVKTMVVDVTDRLVAEDPRLRITSTLQLYWDSIRLAADDGSDPELAVTRVEPSSAVLWERGFSAPLPVMGVPGMDWFDWDTLAEPRWNQHPGLYTRYGETVSLLGAADDRFVIFGAGDALHVRFDAAAVPPPAPGMQRDYLLFLDGWAKDRDPNTVDALFVEPLPFHGMSGYPLAEGEAFPDDEAHRAWRVDWNTRPSKRWIEPLVPR